MVTCHVAAKLCYENVYFNGSIYLGLQRTSHTGKLTYTGELLPSAVLKTMHSIFPVQGVL